jgi:hypothetical protein
LSALIVSGGASKARVEEKVESRSDVEENKVKERARRAGGSAGG